MRTRVSNGCRALLCIVTASLAAFIVGCGGANSTYNPALTGTGSNPASFSLTVLPPSVTIAQGQTATYQATVNAVNGFASPVTLSVSGLPAGTTAAFSPASVTPTSAGATSTLTITTTAGGPGSLVGTIRSADGTPVGRSTPTVTAAGAGITQQAAVTLVVTAAFN